MDRVAKVSSHLSPNRVLASDESGSIGAHVSDLHATLFADMPFSLKQHGGKLVANVLKAHGVEFVFCLSGGHISPILAACEEQSIRIIDVRHEVTSVFAADAVARLTGKPGVCAVTAGPGVTNTITAVKNAQMAESPLVLLGGCAATLTRDRGALQDVDQMSILKSVCKYSVTVTSARDIVPALRRALRESMSGVPGPCFVELPLDVLYPIPEAMAGMGLAERKYKKLLDPADFSRILLPVEYASKQALLDAKQGDEAIFLEVKPELRQPALLDHYMRFKLRGMFAGAFSPDTQYGPLPVDVPQPQPAHVAQVIALLKQSKTPVLLLGSQASLGGPEAMKALQDAVEALGVPTFLGGMARGLLGSKSSTHIRQNRGGALKKADLIILAGAICDFRLGYGRELPKTAKVVSINRGHTAATLNMRMFWNAELVSVADPGQFVRDLAKGFSSQGNLGLKQWAAGLKQAEVAKDLANRQKASEPAFGRVPKWENGPTKYEQGNSQAKQLINPIALLTAVEQVLPDNAILVADGGDFVATASYILKPRGPLQWLDPGAFGTLGVGGGFALGAALVRPEAEVWLIWGDGSAGYSIAEFDTFTKHGLKVVAVIGNDASWNQIEREQLPMFGSDTACALKYLHYDLVAKGYGADGFTIEDPNEDLVAALEKARLACQSAPVVVNALIGKTNFREGSISV